MQGISKKLTYPSKRKLYAYKNRIPLALERFGVAKEKAWKPGEIYLDFDAPRSRYFQGRGFRLYGIFAVCHTLGLSPRSICCQRSNKGWHYTITLKPDQRIFRRASGLPSRIETVALQFALGSDRKRETLNLMRVLALGRVSNKRWESAKWNLLFREKLS